MLRERCFPFLVGVASLCAVPGVARGDDAATAPWEDASSPTAQPTIAAHAYTLAECLALADRNFPNLWAARARLAFAHAQLEEAKWTPWFQWSAQSQFGVTPQLTGTVIYPQATLTNRNVSGLDGLLPFFGFSINGVVPLYTFGKIETAREASEANVRVS